MYVNARRIHGVGFWKASSRASVAPILAAFEVSDMAQALARRKRLSDVSERKAASQAATWSQMSETTSRERVMAQA